jgi:predicted ester cyclase
VNDIDIRALMRRTYEDIYPADDEAALAEVVAEHCVSHGDGSPGLSGFAGVAATMHWLAHTFADRTWKIHRIGVDDDVAMMFCTFRGRQVGDLPGLPATGRTCAVNQVQIVRFHAGKGVEHWGVRDDAAMFRQLTAEHG